MKDSQRLAQALSNEALSNVREAQSSQSIKQLQRANSYKKRHGQPTQMNNRNSKPDFSSPVDSGGNLTNDGSLLTPTSALRAANGQ